MLARRLGGGRRLDVRTRRTLSCTMERERGKIGEGKRERTFDGDVTITITPAVAPQLRVFQETLVVPLSILSLGRRAVCCHSDQVLALLNVVVRSEPDSACVCFIEQTLFCYDRLFHGQRISTGRADGIRRSLRHTEGPPTKKRTTADASRLTRPVRTHRILKVDHIHGRAFRDVRHKAYDCDSETGNWEANTWGRGEGGRECLAPAVRRSIPRCSCYAMLFGPIGSR
jgi:hypothetical protein